MTDFENHHCVEFREGEFITKVMYADESAIFVNNEDEAFTILFGIKATV